MLQLETCAKTPCTVSQLSAALPTPAPPSPAGPLSAWGAVSLLERHALTQLWGWVHTHCMFCLSHWFCWQSLGSCAQPLLCLQNVCTEPGQVFTYYSVFLAVFVLLNNISSSAPSCIPPVNGLCYSSDIGKLLGNCCSGSMCIPAAGSQDYFCQSLMEIGGNCNQTVSTQSSSIQWMATQNSLK